jgi:hypothetical protein
MISEIFSGSAMVGMVHFLKQEATQPLQTASQSSASTVAAFKCVVCFCFIYYTPADILI